MAAGRLTHPPRPPIPIVPFDGAAAEAARARQARLVKPPGSLGRLEELAVWLAGVTGDERPAVRARVVVAAADDDVGVVTALAGHVGADVVLVDAGVRDARDIGHEAALTVEEVAAAVDAGRALAASAAADGITLLVGGAMGISSTTRATALACWLTGRPPSELAGPGTAVARALELHGEAARGPLGALRRMGGGEICVLVGLALGAGEQGLGYVCDGVPATAAAAVAVAVEPDLRPRLLAGHRASEPAHGALLSHLGLDPVLDLGMRLGDGSGAMAALAVLQLAAAAHDGMATFADAGV